MSTNTTKFSIGDLVRLPSGDVGIVTDWDLVLMCHAVKIKVFPLVGFFAKLFLIVTFQWKTEFVGKEVSKLTKIAH